MEAPGSRSKMDKLGKRMAANESLSESDREFFAKIYDFYENLLDEVAETLQIAGYNPTSRVKTTGTLLDKLRREHGIQLTRIVDFAGTRVVLDGGRRRQEVEVEKIAALFSAHDRKPSLIDRRIQPSHGYRAIHIVVYPNGFPVEIQVRTELQNLWAQLFERYADQWGRQIRYGGQPDPLVVSDPETIGIQENLIQLLHDLSDKIDLLESSQARNEWLRCELDRMNTLADEVPPEGADKLATTPGTLESYLEVRTGLIRQLNRLIDDRRRRNRIVRRNLKLNSPSMRGVSTALKIVTSRMTDFIEENGLLARANERYAREALQILSEIPDRKVEK